MAAAPALAHWQLWVVYHTTASPHSAAGMPSPHLEALGHVRHDASGVVAVLRERGGGIGGNMQFVTLSKKVDFSRLAPSCQTTQVHHPDGSHPQLPAGHPTAAIYLASLLQLTDKISSRSEEETK